MLVLKEMALMQELAKIRAERPDNFEENSDSDSSTAGTSTQASTRGRGRGRGSRGRRGGASSSRGATSSAGGTTGRRGRGRGRGRGAASLVTATDSPSQPSPRLEISGLTSTRVCVHYYCLKCLNWRVWSCFVQTSRPSKRTLAYEDDDEPFSAPKKKASKLASKTDCVDVRLLR